jgi:hypothetical protein
MRAVREADVFREEGCCAARLSPGCPCQGCGECCGVYAVVEGLQVVYEQLRVGTCILVFGLSYWIRPVAHESHLFPDSRYTADVESIAPVFWAHVVP